MDNSWKKVEMSPAWNSKDEEGVFRLKKGDELVGTYQGKEEHIGSNDSNLYTFKCDSKMISVWGTSLLDVRFKNLEVGEEVKVVYLGKIKSEKTGRSYHNFDVFHKEAELPTVNEEADTSLKDEDEPTQEELDKVFGKE